MLKSDNERIIVNDYIENDPLSEENLDKSLNFLHEFRLLLPEKTIWLYTGYDFEFLQNKFKEYQYTPFASCADEWLNRWEIISKCNVLIDGRYIDSQRNITKKWAGSDNQRVINVKKSLQQGKVVLYCD